MANTETGAQKDLVVEARTLADYADGFAAGLQNPTLSRVSSALRQLCDEVERLRSSKPRIKEAMIDEILACDKCDLCEEHHA